MVIFNSEGIADIYCDSTEKKCVHRALDDLRRDLLKASNKNTDIKNHLPTQEQGVFVVGTLSNPSFEKFIADLNISVNVKRADWEKYHMLTFGEHNENLIICGSDPRGTMWGIYDFCKNELGVDPLYHWTEQEIKRREALIVEGNYTAQPETYRFRGWFINDEDLLSEWKSDGGERNIDYPFYNQVVHPDVMEIIIETALRLKQNLIIPASFLDIENPAEENIVRMVTERGLFISQHHIEPLGVSHFAWESYQKERAVIDPSFNRNREQFIEIWTHYVKKWARYENVIWQLGLRGRTDNPVWTDDESVPDTMEGRGALISSAMKTQVEIIENVLGHKNFISTSTMWMEGSELLGQGHLTLPPSTALIFADHGPSQMLDKDFYSVERNPERSYGIYYHAAFIGTGPHLVQGNPLEKIYFNYENSVRKGDTYYSILNVANIREVILQIKAVADITWDITAFNAEAWLNEFCREQFGDRCAGQVSAIYTKLFASFPCPENKRINGNMLLTDGMTRVVGNAIINRMEGLPTWRSLFVNPLVYNDLGLAEYADNFAKLASSGLREFNKTYAEAVAMLPKIPEDRKQFYTSNIIVQLEIIIGLYSWLHSLINAATEPNCNKKKAYLNEAACSLKGAVSDRLKAEYGKWKGWYRGDKKINLVKLLERTENLLINGGVFGF